MRSTLFVLLFLGLAGCRATRVERQDAAVLPLDAPGPTPDAPFTFLDAGDAGPQPDTGGFCGGEQIALTRLPARLVFVVDRSSSTLQPADRALMPTATDLGSCADTNARPATGIRYRTLWDDLGGAVAEVAAGRDDAVDFGLTLFPGPGAIEGAITGDAFCTARPPTSLVTPAPGVGDRIAAALSAAANMPLCAGGFTPTRRALEVAADALGPDGDGVLVLATDGAPNCGTAGSAGCTCTTSTAFCGALGTIGCLDDGATIETLTRLRERGIRTYVVGIPGTEGYAAVLDAMATAGGTARPGPTAYYRADDAAALLAALGTISDREVSCRFALASPPPDLENVNVLLDGAPARRDPVDGWVLEADGSAIELVGETCGRLRRSEISNIEFLFGCPYLG
jgi:hypothetical protein